MRDRFLNDLGSVPSARTRSRDVSRSPMRERSTGDFDYDGAGKSPARCFINSPIRNNEALEKPLIGGNIVVNSPVRESDFTEFDGGFPKSPMRERFLSDLRTVPNTPMRSTDLSRSPMRERVQTDLNHDGLGKLPASPRNVSRSPIRESRVPMSVRSRNVSRSPMRKGKNVTGLEDVNESPATSIAGDFPRSPMRRGLVSEFDENAEAEQEEAGVSTSDVGKEASGRKLTLKSSFSSWLTENGHIGQSNDSYAGRKTWRDQVGLGVDQISGTRESVHRNDDRMSSEGSIDDRVHAINPRKKSLYGDRFRGVGVYATLKTSIDQSAARRDGVGVIHGNLKAFVERGRMPASSSSTAERASNYCLNSHGSYSEPRYSFESLRGPASLQDLEMERVELLQRYNELSKQLGNLDGKRISSSGSYSGTDDYSEDEFGRIKARSVQQFAPARGIRRPAYFGHFSGPVRHAADMDDFHPPHYNDPFSGQMTRGPQHQFSKYTLGSVGGRCDQDSPRSYIDETLYHHPSCSCPRCYADDWQGQDLPYSLDGRRSANLVDNQRSTRSMNLDRNSQRVYNSRMAYSNPLERRSHLGHHPRRGELADLNKQLCIPICGGAPFILCKGCFRLLKLPRKLMVKQPNQYKLKCGVCSAVVSFDLQSKSLSFFSAKQNQEFVEAGSGLITGFKELSLDDHRNSCDATRTNIGSCDFDAVGNSFQSVDSEASEVSKAQRLGANLAGNASHLSPSSSRSSKDDRSSDNMSARSSQPISTEMPVKINLVPPPPGSPLRDLLDYSNHFRKLQAGDVINHTREEKQEIEKEVSLDGPMQNTTVATEMEVHSHEGPPTSFSPDEDVPRREDDVVNNKDGEASITRSMSPGRAEVYVNGQCIPQHLVEKAEKFAGTIEPGDYWYDSKAGFWGVMGHRCLGIIPPFIREFGVAMPANCSRGDTTVYVNGRQLHRKDLNILVGRGLPATRNKSYIIDIYGKVMDEATKKFVVNLGKLAPTVERKRRGFGMQVPDHLDDE